MSPVDNLADATPTAPRRKGERTAQRILDASEQLFAEKGYSGTTLRDVAEAVGIRIPSLYNHFASKDLLYAAVLDRGVTPVLELLDEAMAAVQEQRLEPARVISEVMALLEQHPRLPHLLLHETLGGGRRLTPMLRERIAPVFAKAHAVARSSSQAQHWPNEQIPMLVLALYHVVVGFHTIAPLYEATVGDDLTSQAALDGQTRFLTALVEQLFPEPPVPTQA